MDPAGRARFGVATDCGRVFWCGNFSAGRRWLPAGAVDRTVLAPASGIRLSASERPVWNRYHRYPVLVFDWMSRLECEFYGSGPTMGPIA